MPEAFDPYHKWLGIPPKDQPPNHYRLLALDLFESDPDVIDAAASKQMAYLRNLATGPHVALSQKLLNELAAARICLLNPEKKAEYDQSLRAKAMPVVSPTTATVRKRSSLNPVILAGAGVAAVLLVAILIFATSGSNEPPQPAVASAKPTTIDTSPPPVVPKPLVKPEPVAEAKPDPQPEPPRPENSLGNLLNQPEPASEPKPEPEPDSQQVAPKTTQTKDDEGEVVYLIDLTPTTTQAHFYSTKRKSRVVGGTEYLHSVLSHPVNETTPSRGVYNINGKYQLLVGAVGIEDSATTASPQVFWVLGDGKELWKSSPVSPQSKKGEDFRIDVSGVQKLELLTRSLGSHWAANNIWIDIRLVTYPKDKQSTPDEQAVADDDCETIYLTDLKPVSVNAHDFTQNKLHSVNGTQYLHGMQAHPHHWDTPAHIVFDLESKYDLLVGGVGIVDGSAPASPQCFYVVGDGKELWRSDSFKPPKTQQFRIDVSGVRKLELFADSIYDSHFGAHNFWMDPRLLRLPKEKAVVQSKPDPVVLIKPEQKLEPVVESGSNGTEPVSPSNVEDTPAIPPPPPDAEDQLKSALAEAKSPEEFRAVAEKALRYVDQAILTGDGETAKVLMTWAVAAAREAKDDALSKTATLRYLEVQGPLTEEVTEGARKRWETWKPPLGTKEEASSGMVVLSDELVTATAPPERSLADLVRDRQEALQSMQAGDNRQLTTSTPHLIQSRTNEWNGSSSDYAQYANRRFSVGMGSGNRNGYGQAGIEIEGLRELEVTVERTGRYTGWDANDFAGFIIDYHTASGYSKRVALSIGFHNKKRSSPGPPWGTGRKFDESHDLGNHAAYTLKLSQWAPLEWNGRIWFTVMLQNAGTNSALSAVIVSPSEWETQP